MKKGGSNHSWSELLLITCFFLIVAIIIILLRLKTAEPVMEVHEARPTEPQTTIINYPNSVLTGEPFTITWESDGPENLISTHTSVHINYEIFDGKQPIMESYATDESFDLDPSDFTPFISNFADGDYKIPQSFQGSTVAPEHPGVMHLISHLVVNGADYWSDEIDITINERK